MKPFLKWAGSKQAMVPVLQPLVPDDYRLYVEPFVGAGALFFAVEPKRAILSDTNKLLISTYKAVRNNAGKVLDLLCGHQDKHNENYYYSLRERGPGNVQNEAAAWMIYMNKAGFNGLYRVNKMGKFNVPWGQRDKSALVDEVTIRRCSRVLKRCDVQLHGRDFGASIRYARAGSFVYCDPPYPGSSPTTGFDAYTSTGFGATEHERLRDCVARAAQRGAVTVVSNASVPVILHLYRGRRFRIMTTEGRRSISAAGGSRGNVEELIITSTSKGKNGKTRTHAA